MRATGVSANPDSAGSRGMEPRRAAEGDYRESGESMETSEDKLLALIREFWEREF